MFFFRRDLNHCPIAKLMRQATDTMIHPSAVLGKISILCTIPALFFPVGRHLSWPGSCLQGRKSFPIKHLDSSLRNGLKNRANRLLRTSCQTEIQGRFLFDQLGPLFCSPRVAIGYPHPFQNEMIPFPDRFFTSLRTPALIPLEIDTGTAEVIHSFGHFQ